jgi:hypothetical protein
MAIKRIRFLRYEEDITEIQHSNIYVTVELDDGSEYIVYLATIENISYLMEKDKCNYLEVGYPIIIVKSLSKAIIIDTIKAYVKENDGYWLKLYHFADMIDPRLFNQLQAEAKILDKYEHKKYELPELDDKKLKELYVVYEGKDLE